MLTVSLHGIRLTAPYGLYEEEPVLGNEFEIDIDLYLPVQHGQPWPFADYTLIREIVSDAFAREGKLLETLVQAIHTRLKSSFPDAAKAKVTIRKLHPPMPGDVGAAQVSYEG
jgi:dihydroneopterin aldolase